MPYELIPVERLVVNPANDRHGELQNETAAIAELFRLREQHMRNLARDIKDERTVYDPPLVYPDGENFIVFDGNRRVTCLKLTLHPERAPSQDLQAFFRALQQEWDQPIPDELECQVEDDREIIDSIIYRRHTGSQGGVGQSDWDDRAKHNFVERTGRGGRVDVAVQVEEFLRERDRLPGAQIPRSTLNRLLSSEVFRNRVGISAIGNSFAFTHNPDAVVEGLARIADDLAARRVVLGDLWNNAGKTAYLNRLEVDGLLPGERDLLEGGDQQRPPQRPRRRGRPPIRQRPPTVIDPEEQEIPWRADQARIRAVWHELQTLDVAHFPNAISALLRILVELSTESLLRNAKEEVGQGLSANFRRAMNYLRDHEVIDHDYFVELDGMRQHTELISIQSMQRYVHSPNFAPLPDEIAAHWMRLRMYIVACLTH